MSTIHDENLERMKKIADIIAKRNKKLKKQSDEAKKNNESATYHKLDSISTLDQEFEDEVLKEVDEIAKSGNNEQFASLNKKYIDLYEEAKRDYIELYIKMLNLTSTLETAITRGQSAYTALETEVSVYKKQLDEVAEAYVENEHKIDEVNKANLQYRETIAKLNAEHEKTKIDMQKLEQKQAEMVATSRDNKTHNAKELEENKQKIYAEMKSAINKLEMVKNEMQVQIALETKRNEDAAAKHMQEIKQKFGTESTKLKSFMDEEKRKSDAQRLQISRVQTESTRGIHAMKGEIEQKLGAKSEELKLFMEQEKTTNERHRLHLLAQSRKDIQDMIQELSSISGNERERLDAMAKELLAKIQTEQQNRLKQIEADAKQALINVQDEYKKMLDSGKQDMQSKIDILTKVEHTFNQILEQIQEQYGKQTANINEIRQMLNETQATKEQILSEINAMHVQNQQTISEINTQLEQTSSMLGIANDANIDVKEIKEYIISQLNKTKLYTRQTFEHNQELLKNAKEISTDILDSKQAIEQKINEMNKLEVRLHEMMTNKTSSIDAKLEELTRIQADIKVNSDRAQEMYNKIEEEYKRFGETLQRLYDTEHKKLEGSFAEASAQTKKVMLDVVETRKKIERRSRVIRTYFDKAMKAQKIASASNKKAIQLTLNAEAQQKQVKEILEKINVAQESQKRELLEQKTHMDTTLASLVKQIVQETLHSVEQEIHAIETLQRVHDTLTAHKEEEDRNTPIDTPQPTRSSPIHTLPYNVYTPLLYRQEQKYVPILYMSDNMARDTLNIIKQYFANGDNVQLKVNTTIMLYNVVNRKSSTLDIIMKDVDKKYNEQKNKFVGVDKQTFYNNFYLMNLRYHILNFIFDEHKLDATKNIPAKYIPSFDPAIMTSVDNFITSIMKNIEKHTKNIDRIEYMDKNRISVLYRKIIASTH